MTRSIVALVVVMLAIGASVAYAAVRATSSDPTQVCVNHASGLMRVATVCRAGEYPLTIGGGGEVRVTQNGTFTADPGQTVGKTLPLTGITVSGKCEYVGSPPAPSPTILPRVELQAASGKKLDAFGTGQVGDVIQGDSFLTYPLGPVTSTPPEPLYEHGSGWTTVIATSNGATATITVGGSGDWSDQSCTYLWQAVEALN